MKFPSSFSTKSSGDFKSDKLLINDSSTGTNKTATVKQIADALKLGVGGAHEEGTDNTASGTNSHAEGWGNKATGAQAHAEGRLTAASANQSHTEGYGTKATANGAHAEGDTTTAAGAYSHAEGCETQANGDYSHAEGDHTIANGRNQLVVGQYNTIDTQNAYAFIVGNGTTAKRSNAFAVRKDGTTEMNGMSVSGQSDLAGNLKLNGNFDLQGELYINGKKLDPDNLNTGGSNCYCDHNTPTLTDPALRAALIPMRFYSFRQPEDGIMTQYVVLPLDIDPSEYDILFRKRSRVRFRKDKTENYRRQYTGWHDVLLSSANSPEGKKEPILAVEKLLYIGLRDNSDKLPKELANVLNKKEIVYQVIWSLFSAPGQPRIITEYLTKYIYDQMTVNTKDTLIYGEVLRKGKLAIVLADKETGHIRSEYATFRIKRNNDPRDKVVAYSVTAL